MKYNIKIKIYITEENKKLNNLLLLFVICRI